MRLGLVNCDQLTLDEMRGLPQLTGIYRAAIARPWHSTHQTRLNDTRTELTNMIHFPNGMEAINSKREAIFFQEALDPLLKGARCVAFTVMNEQIVGIAEQAYSDMTAAVPGDKVR